MRKKRNIWPALLLAAVLALAGCSTEEPSGEAAQTAQTEETEQEEEPVIGESGLLSLPEDQAKKDTLTPELEELTRIHSPVIYGIYTDNWDDPMEIDPEYFPIYYQYFRFNMPGMKEKMGEYTNEETYQILVPQEAMEEVVTSHFDVPIEHIRKSRWYVPEQQAYELCGIGGGWECQIASAKQQDDLLVMEYKTYTGQNKPMSHGTITARTEGDSWKYLSVTGEEYLSYQLEYPAATSTSYHDGAYWSTGQTSGGSTIDKNGTEVIWRGDSLEDIIRFYEGKIEEIGGTGETGQPDGENSWSWNGTYGADKKLLNIQVYGAGVTYAIRIMVEE